MQISAQTAHAAYRTGQVGSAGPLRIVVLLYEGALRFSRQALDRFDDPASRGQALGRAHGIISELMAALDHEKGADIAANLDGLYGYMLDSLTAANLSADREALASTIRVLETLLPAWREIESRGQEDATQP
jgi:flagellar protein FliS